MTDNLFSPAVQYDPFAVERAQWNAFEQVGDQAMHGIWCYAKEGPHFDDDLDWCPVNRNVIKFQPRPHTNADVTLTFLKALRPAGPWVLTAIDPVTEAIETITVRTADEVAAFVGRYNGKRNLYYSVNPTRTELRKKAKKTDIAAIEYALADLDPNKGEASNAAKARYLRQLEGAFEPKPVAAVDSGNGIQCLWRLQELIALGAPIKEKDSLRYGPEDQAKIDDVEARIAAVMQRLGGKVGTQNIDRILRLPGTTNLPNEKKRNDGRVPCSTKLLWFNGAAYPLSAFPKNETKSRDKIPAKEGSDNVTTHNNIADPNGERYIAYAVRCILESELGNIITHGVSVGERSDQFHFVVCSLLEKDFGCDEILALLKQYPNGIAKKYRGRLKWAVDYSFGKWKEKQSAEAEIKSDNITVDPKPRLVIPGFSTDWCDVTKIARRQWLYGQHYIRGFATASIAPGGVGKSTLAIIEGICMASGLELLGVPVEQPCKVWYWNGEEPRVEIARRVHAVCQHYKIDPRTIVADNFHFISGLDGFPIKIVTAGKKGITVNEKLVDDIVAFIKENDFGVVIIDPLISSHSVPENDNVAMDAVAKTWARIAALANCNVEMAHHTRKPIRGDEGETSSSDARGAGSLMDAVRGSRVLNQLTNKEAEDFGVDDRFEYFRTNRGKANMTRRGRASWFKLVSVTIGNGPINDPANGDNVQTVEKWDPPDDTDFITPAHMHAVRARAAKGDYQRDWRAGDNWIGVVIAEVLGLGFDAKKKEDRELIERILKKWVDQNVLKVVTRKTKDTNWKERAFVEPGSWTEAEPANAL